MHPSPPTPELPTPMKQATYASLSFNAKKKQTRREVFLAEMEQVIPWAMLEAIIEPHYPKSGRRGRPPMPLDTMLRIHFMQQWYALSDPGMEDALYEIEGNQYYFGMKAHIGVDVESGLVHTVATTAANEADVTQTEYLLHGKEKSVWGDAGYTGANKRDGLTGRRLTWHIATKPGTLKAMPDGPLKDATRYVVYLKAAVRAKVEHPFRVIKRQFGYTKVRYRGLAKNTGQVLTLFALSNLWMARRCMRVMV